MNVLHVEDSPKMRSILKGALSSFKSIESLESAATIETGMELFTRHTPDVAILDIQLPDGSGLEMARWIKEKHPMTRILILSNNSDVCHRAFSKIAGADYFLDKSMEFEMLGNILNEINKTTNN
jgi:two-component system response regulator DesR